jgi:hypothetical protein
MKQEKKIINVSINIEIFLFCHKAIIIPKQIRRLMLGTEFQFISSKAWRIFQTFIPTKPQLCLSQCSPAQDVKKGSANFTIFFVRVAGESDERN